MKSQRPSFLVQAAQGRKAQTHPPVPADREIPTPLLANEADSQVPCCILDSINFFCFRHICFHNTVFITNKDFRHSLVPLA